MAWGGATVPYNGLWYTFVGAKTDTSSGASDYFSANSGMHVLSSASPGGPTFTDLGELRGANNQQFGFRASAVVHPVDGALLVLTEGYAHIASPNFGFILLRSASGDPNGPWTEHLAYELEGRAMADDPSGTLDSVSYTHLTLPTKA